MSAMLGLPDLRSLFAEAGSEGWSRVGSALVISAGAGFGSPAAGDGKAVTAGASHLLRSAVGRFQVNVSLNSLLAAPTDRF